jgi:glycosyltransferase involved in cell wall biosynthesis
LVQQLGSIIPENKELKKIVNLIIGTNYSNKFGAVKTQGEYLYELLVENNLDAQIVSDHHNFIKRILQTCLAILKLPQKSNLIIQVYGTKSLYLEWLSSIIGIWKRHKIILTLHGGDIPNMYLNSKFKQYFFNGLFRNAKIITAPSEYLFVGLREVGAPLNENKLTIIKNFINLEDYSIDSEVTKKDSIFWMRAFHDVYNPLLALQCLNELKKDGLKLKLYMAGPNQGLLDKTIEEIKVLNLEEDLVLLGKIDNKVKSEIAHKCFVYLNTTRIDNSPVAFLEMMALGLPIVSTNVGGIKYWVQDKSNALLADNNTAIELKENIKKLIIDDNIFNKIRTDNFKKVEEFSKERVSKDWIKILC